MVGEGANPSGQEVLEIAPAKLNFGLRVVGRRADGYHLIESLFVPIDLADEVRVGISPSPEPRVTLECHWASDAQGVEDLPPGEENLAVRAADGFLRSCGRPLAVSVHLTKRIPVAAGLGGGSSDAGAVLRALDALVPGAVGPSALAALALSLGADVPFFLEPRPAIVSGIGERLEPFPGLPSLSLVLANPGPPVSTAAVFQAWDARSPALTTAKPGSTLRSLSDWMAADSGDSVALSSRLGEVLENDLEGAARQLCPSIGQVQRSLLECGAQAVGMSGSGGTSFGIFANKSEANEAARQLALGGDGWVRLAGTLPDR